MLGINDYNKIISNLLNTNDYGIKFNVFNDLGDYIYAVRNNNSISNTINGIISLSPSTLVPIANVPMSITTANIEFAINIDLNAPQTTEDGEYIKYPMVQQVRAIWDNLAQLNNGNSIMQEDSSGNTYAVTLAFTLLTDGLISMESSDSGEILPMSATVSFTVIDGGVSANACSIIVNGEQMPFAQLVVTRTKMLDSAQYLIPPTSVDPYNSTKSYSLQNGIGLDFVSPLLNNTIGNLILEDLLNGQNNKAYAVILMIGSNSKAYIMTTGNLVGTLSAGDNVGMNISFVEINPNYISDGVDGWEVEQATGGSTVTISGSFPKKTTIFWGDGTYLYESESTIDNPYHEYSEPYDGNIYIKLGSDD